MSNCVHPPNHCWHSVVSGMKNFYACCKGCDRVMFTPSEVEELTHGFADDVRDTMVGNILVCRQFMGD